MGRNECVWVCSILVYFFLFVCFGFSLSFLFSLYKLKHTTLFWFRFICYGTRIINGLQWCYETLVITIFRISSPKIVTAYHSVKRFLRVLKVWLRTCLRVNSCELLKQSLTESLTDIRLRSVRLPSHVKRLTILFYDWLVYLYTEDICIVFYNRRDGRELWLYESEGAWERKTYSKVTKKRI